MVCDQTKDEEEKEKFGKGKKTEERISIPD